MKYLTELVKIVYYIQKPMKKKSTLPGSVHSAPVPAKENLRGQGLSNFRRKEND